MGGKSSADASRKLLQISAVHSAHPVRWQLARLEHTPHVGFADARLNAYWGLLRQALKSEFIPGEARRYGSSRENEGPDEQ